VANFGGPGYSTAVDNIFMRTDNGGQSWSTTILPANPPYKRWRDPELAYEQWDELSFDTSLCRFCASFPIGGATSIVWRTDDGGATWLVVRYPTVLRPPVRFRVRTVCIVGLWRDRTAKDPAINCLKALTVGRAGTSVPLKDYPERRFGDPSVVRPTTTAG